MRTRGSVTKRRFDVSANSNDQNQERLDGIRATDGRIRTSLNVSQNMQVTHAICMAFHSDAFVTYSQPEFNTPNYSHQDVSIAAMVSKVLCILDFSKAACPLYLPLQIFCSVCYNPTGIIGEKTDGIMRMKKNEPPSVWGSLGLMGALGLVIAIPIALGAIGGRYLDGIVHTNNVFLLLGLLLGLIMGIYGAYRLLAPFLKR